MSERVQASLPRLFVYGTLAPGEVNEDVLAALDGSWVPARVFGTLHAEGWGHTHGFPALQLDPAAAAVAGQIFYSEDLARHWARLDEFEGEAYRRVVTHAELINGDRCETCVYVLNVEAEDEVLQINRGTSETV